MPQRIIQLCYRKIINDTSQQPWERLVFYDSYQEFLTQAQFYNQEKKYTSFSDLLLHVPGADKLHFLVSTSVVNYVKFLNNQVPDILNQLGKHFLPFKNFRFELINSDTRDQHQHQVAINFYSEPMVWHDTVGEYLLVSPTAATTEAAILTDMFRLQPMLTIYSLQYAPDAGAIESSTIFIGTENLQRNGVVPEL